LNAKFHHSPEGENMRINAITLALALFACGALAVAEDTAGKKSTGKDAKSTTLTGCLQTGHKDGTYMLTSGGTAYELMPQTTMDLKGHVGHKIEVTGMKMATSEAHSASTAAAKAAPAKDEHAGHGAKKATVHEHFKVASMRHLAPTCP
jgi:hypothetical protein